MTRNLLFILSALAIGVGILISMPAQAQSAAGSKPNILLIVGDDVGYGDLGPYLGGKARGMATPSFDKLAAEGMMFTKASRKYVPPEERTATLFPK